YLLFAWFVVQHGSAQQGQTNVACQNLSSEVFYTGEVFFSYGSSSNAFNATRRMNTTIGQAVIGESFNQDYNSGFGFWSNLLLAPSAPTVICSEGDLPDRINVNWQTDPLSPVAVGGFNIYRDGVLLSTEDADVRSFVDFNVIAGQFYTYSVSGKNQFGEGYKGASLGFLNPNGVVTGEVRTLSQNPVQDVLVTLTPTIGAALEFNGSDKVFAEYNPVLNSTKWSVSCWVKLYNNNDNAGILDFGSAINKNFWIHTTASAAGKGIVAGVGTGSGAETMQYIFPAATKDDWHYITMTSNGMSVLLYVDGEFVTTKMVASDRDSSQIYFGSKTGDTGYYKGKLDEVRFYNRQLSQTDLQMGMNRTVNSNANGLLAYWKFDEGVGSKSFDISPNKIKAYLCGASWTSDKPEVQNAGITNAQGIFKIEGVNYGPGTTFTASAAKKFYFNQSLEFNASNEQYAQLTRFDLHDTSTVTFAVKPFDLGSSMTVLSKQGAGGHDQFIASIVAGALKIKIGDSEFSYGTLSAGFHHVAVTMLQNGSTVLAKVYVDGAQAGAEQSFTGVDADFNTGTPWQLGTRIVGGNNSNFFTGLVDEAAFFNNNLTLPEIQLYANTGTEITNAHLKDYFNLNEGLGDSIQDLGFALTGRGALHGASWSVSASIEQTLPHTFTPNSRLVTLNPSNTSTDGVQFTDQSLVPVSGYVRYDGTNCFVEGAEILGDGAHFAPPVFTDKTGKFICELEPGSTVKLSAKYKSHTIVLPFWEIRNIASPVAGILFRDITKREISGQLAGGLCRKSVIPDLAIVKVKVASEDGCFEKVIQLTHADNEGGMFKFTNLPPKPMVISLIEHSNALIYNYFQLQGGATLDLTDSNMVKDFIYFSPPQVELSALDTNKCGDPMLVQSEKYTTEIRVYQDYDGGRCYLQDADISIFNEISDKPQLDTTMTGGKLKYKFVAGLPQLTSPYIKSLTVSATANDQSADNTLTAVVLGKRARQVNFTSTSPEIPILILRDPPGDGSSSRMEKGSEFCLSVGFGITETTGEKSEIVEKVGLDTEIATGIGVEKTTKIEATDTQTFSVEATQSASLSTNLETCVSLNEVIQTNGDEVITDADADLYMGAAMNLLYGITDDLIFDTATCSFKLTTGLMVLPDKFATTFIYSQYQIVNSVIPSLELVGDTTSANRWREILQKNQDEKNKATFLANYSFDAGVIYDQSSSISVSSSVEFSYEFTVTETIANELGIEVDGNGLTGTLEQTLSLGLSASASINNNSTKTVGFTLADNDIGDYFTVDVKKDAVYGTPVFKTLSGASSCPYEKNTVPREEVALSVDHQVVNNVPENDAAVFKFTLGNISQTEETREYLFGIIPESNTDGAVIKVQGGSPTDRPFGLTYAEGQDVVVTVERGPLAYDYEDLEFAIYSECEDSRGVTLGLDMLDPKFYKSFKVDVHFVEPCSRVGIGFPLQDWVLTPASGNDLFITLNDYDVNDLNLELVRVQYRRTQGDGSWINIAEIPKADLGPLFEIVPWDTDGLADGLYEIRAVAQCVGGLESGISKVIKGKIERTAPAIFGTPQPADGVLAVGDEISIQFTEPIRCDLLIQADFTNNNNIGLYDTETGNLVDATISCQGDKIIIVPNVPNRFIENKVLRVQVDNIKDLAGNPFVHTQWEFVVDRNPVHWEGGKVIVTKQKEETITVTRRIVNDGGQSTAYDIQGIPSWVRVYPSSGLLLPGAADEITFQFDSNMAYGKFLDTISINPPEGFEPLIVDCRVLCKSPEWGFDAPAYSQTMNFAVKLNIEGDLSKDEEDIVAAFIDGEVRGTAKVQFLPILPPIGTQYMAFLTVYGNEDDFNKPIHLEIWDASECLRFGQVTESFNFEADNVIGTVGTPQVIHTNSLVRRDIPINNGWNWISFNLKFPNPALNQSLVS
ncbi:MAG: LamG-like jellyroll fold domain-containing protein, partial [Bacteroidota bacterium]